MHRILKLVARITSFIFLGMILYIYAFLPAKVDLSFDQSNTLMFDREQFFYGVILAYALYTVIISFLKKTLTSASRGQEEGKIENLKIWTDGLSVMLNLFFTFSVIFIGMQHNDEHFNITYFTFLIYLGPILLLGWIFYLLYILLAKS
ncbi:MAG: hypothetical protein JXQ96_09785 [Cyclobacteriaceae bacterium]